MAGATTYTTPAFSRANPQPSHQPRSPRLQLKWAFALPSAASVYGQPTIVGGRVYVSGDSGYVYSLDAVSGCVNWSFQAQSGVANGVTIEPRPGHPNQIVADFGDIRGNTYAVDTSNGESGVEDFGG